MVNMRSLEQYPLFTTILGAVCGVGFIVFSSVGPANTPTSEPQVLPHKQDLEKYIRALAELQGAGFSGDVDIVDFGNGVGFSATQSIKEGATVLSIPESLALDVEQARSCRLENTAAASMNAEIPLDCQIERIVVQAVAHKKITRLTGLLALFVMEHRRGAVAGLAPDATSAVLAVMPELSWQAENGLFAIDDEEFRVISAGTSMEGWREVAVNQTTEAHAFIMTALATKIGDNVSIEEVRWAYLVLHAYGQWVEDDDLNDGIEMPRKVIFLWPLFLARPTPEWAHGMQLRYNSDHHIYEAVATRAMRPGEEVLFVNRRLSDASVLCFRGLWLSGRHRARFSFDVSAIPRDPQSQQILQKYGCGAQPLQLYLQAQKTPDPKFLSCMRMLALANNASKLQQIERKNWMKTWPETGMISRQTETVAAELAINSLQQVLNRLSSSSSEIRQRYGNDAVAVRPTVRVREAETMVVISLLKSMKELQVLSSNEYTFEAFRESQRKKRMSPEKDVGQEEWQQQKTVKEVSSRV